MVAQNKLILSALIMAGGLLSIQGCVAANKKQLRKTKYPIADLIVNRWSPRAFSGKALTKDQALTLVEAAGLAPSSYNKQAYVIYYGIKGTKGWDNLFDLLVPFNQSWAKSAGALFLFVSKNTVDGQPWPTHTLDAGAATQNLQLQAFAMGLAAHGMAGFDTERAKKMFNLSDEYTVEAMYAVGVLGDKRSLPEGLQEAEKPADRKPVEEIAVDASTAA